MFYFSMNKRKDGLISGMFKLLNYGNMLVTYEVENKRVLFKLPYRLNENMEKKYNTWHEKEQKIYEDFILVYLDELNKLNELVLSQGKIIHEHCFKTESALLQYEISVEFTEFLKDTTFLFIPKINHYEIETNLDIPINSRGKSNSVKIKLEHFITDKTLQRLWEPFRHQTKYRLHLLHILR